MADQNEPFGGRNAPPELEDRVLRSLRGAGFIEPATARLRRQVVSVAAIASALLLGFFGGRLSRTPAANDSLPSFLLLLYEDAGYRDDRPVNEIVAEYRAWGDSLQRVGELVTSAKLSDAHVNLPPAKAVGAPHQVPSGFFVVRARSLDEATTVAETSPHLKYGGRILLTAVDHRSTVSVNSARFLVSAERKQ